MSEMQSIKVSDEIKSFIRDDIDSWFFFYSTEYLLQYIYILCNIVFLSYNGVFPFSGDN